MADVRPPSGPLTPSWDGTKIWSRLWICRKQMLTWSLGTRCLWQMNTRERKRKEAGKQTDRLHRVRAQRSLWPHSGRNTAPQGQGARWQVTGPRHLHLSPSPDAGCLWKGVRVGLKAGPVCWVLPGRALWGPPLRICSEICLHSFI